MKNIKILFLFICLILFYGMAVVAEETSKEGLQPKIPFLTEIDAIADAALKEFHVPGAAVGIVANGKILLTKGYGFRDAAGKLPVTENTLFAIGSCSKAFAGFILGTLAEDGSIALDDPVAEYLPDFKLSDDYVTRHLTIRNLLTHSSGLPRHDFLWYNSELTMQELLPRLQYLEPVCGINEQFLYNNLMFAVAGLVIEKVTGKSWEQVVQDRVFMPLGMTRSNCSIESTQASDDYSLPHADCKGKPEAIPFRPLSNIGPAGSINSCVSDMAQWIKLQLEGDDRLMTPDMLQETRTAHLSFMFPCPLKPDIAYMGYGLGWFIGTYEGHALIEHGGGIDGFISRVSLLPDDHIGVVVLTNSSSGGGFAANCIANSIVDKLLKLEDTDWIACACNLRERMVELQRMMQEQADNNITTGTKPTLAIEDYAGIYEHPGYGRVIVSISDGSLAATYNRIMTPLVHVEQDRFKGSPDAVDPVFCQMGFSFTMDGNGGIEGLLIPFEPFVKPIFFQKKKAEF